MPTKKKSKPVSSKTSAKKAKPSVVASQSKAGTQKTAPQKPFKLKINPEYEVLLPPLTPDEFELLKESIRNYGQELPILAGKDGTIYDGHNRYKICMELGIEPRYEIVDRKDDKSIKLWIIGKQLGQRNLTTFQRVECARQHKALIAAIAKDNQRAGGGAVREKSTEPVVVRDKLAEMAKTSTNTVSKAEYIMEHADEETKKKLRNKDKSVSINKVYNNLKAEQAKKEPAKSKTVTAASTSKKEKPTKQQDVICETSDPPHGFQEDSAPTEIPTSEVLASVLATKEQDELNNYLLEFLQYLATKKQVRLSRFCREVFVKGFNTMNNTGQITTILGIFQWCRDSELFNKAKIIELLGITFDEQPCANQ